MLINDLEHLETVKEAPEVVGGSGNFSLDAAQSSLANVWQGAYSGAYANSFDEDAIATAASLNDSTLLQTNQAVIL